MQQAVDYESASVEPEPTRVAMALCIVAYVATVVVVDGLPLVVASDRSPGSWSSLLAMLAVYEYGFLWNFALAGLLAIAASILQLLFGLTSLTPLIAIAATLPFAGFGIDYYALVVNSH